MDTPKNLLPKLPQPVVRKTRTAPAERSLQRLDAVVVLFDTMATLEKSPLPGGSTLATLLRRQGEEQVVTTTLPGKNATMLVACRIAKDCDRFAQLEHCRRAAAVATAGKPKRVGVIVLGRDNDEAQVHEDAVYAITLAPFQLPKFSAKRRPAAVFADITLYTESRPDTRRVVATARGNCLARWLTAMPPSHLDGHGYRAIAEYLCKQNGWRYRFHSASALKRRGAGAFTAVAQGNEDDSAGIVHIRRSAPNKSSKLSVALVGKGIIFDTGGTNLKPFDGMLNMHVDMGGSAVAMGALLALSELDAKLSIDVWLGITENRTGPRAYKSQDVVTSLSGKTIQTIHTDAEGRMVLADTLTLAGREKPSLILDFATLTGACVNAVTPRYAGVFTNRQTLHSLLIDHGVSVGERVWPFPIGGEFLKLLKSETADIMQCSPGGGGDHILAATFLNTFVPAKIPWIHMDLSAVEHKGGLGAAATNITGFGVAYTTELLLDHASTLAKTKA
ncbi:MAG: leucyl aminopeptidase family protein [Pseudomonadota bacterium]